MQKKIRTTILIMGLLVFTTFLVGIRPINAEPKKTTALPTTIKIGGVFPITGRPEAGRDRRDAFLMAVYEINNQTGTDRILPAGVNLLPNVQDDLNTPEGAQAAADALVAWEADIVCGTSGSSNSMTMASTFTPHKIPQISYASSSPALTNRTAYPYFMRVAASDAWQGVAVSDLVQAFNWTKGAVIHTSDAYGTGLIEVFTTDFTAAGGTVVTDQIFDANALEVSTQVQALKDAEVEFILGNFIDKDAATCMKEAKNLGVDNLPWITTDGWSTTATFADEDDVKDAMQKSIGTTPAPLTGAGYATFNTSWFSTDWAFLAGPKNSQDTGSAFNSYAPLSYDAVYVAAKGLAAAGSVDGDELLDALYDVTLEGASGSVSFDEYGEVIGRYDYVQLVDETYTTFGEWQDGPTFIDGEITLADCSEWSIASNKITNTKEGPCPAAPGFELLIAVFAVGVLVAIVGRKRK
ncbi:MAG: ABC transporter substrate-binding protein [Candidatus Heimdallarchaeota archaeon]|nr:MAG: ABC transporter substrate-binding protein [Candidatus Heimdallarchaeota archaeon]